jgi:hypothetical protein
MKHHLFWGTIIGVIVFCTAFAVGAYKYELKLDLWFSYIGAAVTAMAFGFGTYFVVLAVNAYSHVTVIRQTEEKITETLREAALARDELNQAKQSIATSMSEAEGEAFSVIEAVMVAMVEFVQHLPRGSEPRKGTAAKKLEQATSCIRARFICKRSPDESAVLSAALTLVNYHDEDAIEVLKVAKARFQSSSQTCASLDYSIRAIQMALNKR